MRAAAIRLQAGHKVQSSLCHVVFVWVPTPAGTSRQQLSIPASLSLTLTWLQYHCDTHMTRVMARHGSVMRHMLVERWGFAKRSGAVRVTCQHEAALKGFQLMQVRFNCVASASRP